MASSRAIGSSSILVSSLDALQLLAHSIGAVVGHDKGEALGLALVKLLHSLVVTSEQFAILNVKTFLVFNLQCSIRLLGQFPLGFIHSKVDALHLLQRLGQVNSSFIVLLDILDHFVLHRSKSCIVVFAWSLGMKLVFFVILFNSIVGLLSIVSPGRSIVPVSSSSTAAMAIPGASSSTGVIQSNSRQFCSSCRLGYRM